MGWLTDRQTYRQQDGRTDTIQLAVVKKSSLANSTYGHTYVRQCVYVYHSSSMHAASSKETGREKAKLPSNIYLVL